MFTLPNYINMNRSLLRRAAAGLAAAMLVLCFFGAGARAEAGIESWAALQEAIDRAGHGDVVTLTDDLVALEADDGLTVPAGWRMTLDLNGHTLDRNQKERTERLGSAIHVEAGAVLTLRDSGGTGVITGGFHDNGGGILNHGTLIMEGGRVTGNTALHAGGGLANYGAMLLVGGSVDGNTALQCGGGVFNHAKARLTVDGGIVSGNSSGKQDDIANDGALTLIGAEDNEVRIEDMPVLRRFLAQQSIIPTVALLVALLLAVWTDAYLGRDHKRVMVIIIALLFSLILQNYLDNTLSSNGANNALRMPVTIYGYVVRPVILTLFLYILKPEGRYRLVWALVAVNAAVYLSAFFSRIAFHFTVNGHFKSGPLRHTCTLVSALLFGYLLYLSIRRFHPRARKESWLPILVTVLIAGAVVMDFNAIVNEQPLSFLTVAIAIGCVFYYVWLHLYFVREHEEALRAGQRIQLALSQIKPHFLYNALSTIEELCESDPKAARMATAMFSDYLHGNIDAIDRMNAIPFSRELEHTKLYLEIERLRFGDALNVRYDTACMNFSLPALTLEPLVENAVRHGVRKNERGMGTVTIASRETRDYYEASVTDDGPGFEPSDLPDDRNHVGIRNVRDRLQSVCGGSLKIVSAPGQGTTATIIIPKTHREGDDD